MALGEENEAKELQDPENQKVCCEILIPRNDKKVRTTIPQWYDRLNKTWTMTVSIYMANRDEHNLTCFYS